ncbi:MAG TPA: hypothetical protein VM348_06135 [Brevundimonas sp.]|nr:hypothetical protein [Brevundimonas sp.]
MLKKITLAALLASSVVATVPTSAAAQDVTCMLINGCYVTGGEWVCPSPAVFMLCTDS